MSTNGQSTTQLETMLLVDLSDETVRLRQELEQARRMAALWKQAAKEWRQAAHECQAAQPPSRVPVVGELSANTRPADFQYFAQHAATLYAVRTTE